LAKTRGRQIRPRTGTEKAFGLALREIRVRRKISQERLGLDAEFDRTYVSLIEQWNSEPRKPDA
jgi:hypothetical protein